MMFRSAWCGLHLERKRRKRQKRKLKKREVRMGRTARCFTCSFSLSLPSVEYAQIDWHDFVIVETINFNENEAGESL